MEPRPMEIDPIDGGPKDNSGIPPPPPPSSTVVSSSTPVLIPMQVSEEEDARQAIEMLRGDDVSARVAAANRLESVATVLGEQRTREELLPFLTEGIDDEDEVLLALATSLGKMIPQVGGGMYAHTLLPPLELLLMVEEITVRDAASASAQTIADSLPDETFQNQYEAMLKRLATKEWFTARISSAGLLAKAYPRLTPTQQQQHVLLFVRLCQDETPMVRRVAAQHLGEMLENVVQAVGRKSLQEEGVAATLLIPLYEELASNEQPDSVRLQTTQNCVSFGRVIGALVTTPSSEKSLTENELALIQRLLPLIVATIDDRSWRVRWTAAAKFANVIKAYNPIPGAMDILIPAYEKLLQDPEAEVRTAATFNLALVAQGCETKVLPAMGMSTEDEMMMTTSTTTTTTNATNYTGERVTSAERLVKRVTSLTEDDSEHVRAALAMVATELAPILGKDATITHLVPPILLLLRDAASEVRLNLISSLESLNKVIGVDLLSQSLLPAILDLAHDGKWRIRLAIIQQIPLLAKQLGQDFFTDKLSSICVAWLGDDIATIRNAATTNLKELTLLFGTEWACYNLIPPVDDIRHNSSYLRRLTAVQGCAQMMDAMDPAIAQVELLPILLEMAIDPVPNIRFNVAQSLGNLGSICDLMTYEQQILPVLSLLQEDLDRDVRFYADKASAKLEEEYASKK
ncbi:peptidase C14 caspase catalytic subunit-like protein [Nitzschia inconspicua]|uniref:Peptidase C14 caspase catalytic subunit-like protein n=1 Tax=Nitzschia inconspicua TaxID=303405 RepID=A0A9K3KV34_9STRA|nr:peptidase C14 caspase catalytic subunit-like protein [Nitzschia inconspicua]